MKYFNGNVILVTGAIGSGKTLYTVSGLKVLKELEDKKPLDQQRAFYTDIDGLTLDGFLVSPEDWRTVPLGSVIVYDECQLNPFFQADGKSVSSHEFVLELTLARRKGYTIIFISQSPRFVHGTIRNLANEHIHVQRLHGAEKSLICRYPKPVLNPDSKSNISMCSDKFNWDYPKTTYNDYSSLDSGADNISHQVKFRIPAPLIKGFIFILILFLCLVYYFGSSFFSDDAPVSASASAASAASLLAPVAPVEPEPVLGSIVGAYFDNDNNCTVYDSNAITVINHPNCLDVLTSSPNVYTYDNYARVAASIESKINSIESQDHAIFWSGI